MATRSDSTRATSKRSNRSKLDAISLLTADHDKVKKLFKEFEQAHEEEDEEGAGEIAGQICNELTVHATVEEEIFYPAVRKAIDDSDLVNEAEVEHASAKDLIAQIEEMSDSDEKYAATVTVLGEYVDHHVKEEQDEMFPKVKSARLDMEALGAKMMKRKQELMAELGMDEGEEEEGDKS